jgi:branched-chain amino acid transport system ATP-binding protein
MPAITAEHKPREDDTRRMGPDPATSARPAAADRPQLAATAVSKHFGGVRAVEDVSISVAQGEVVSIIGPNGAGKTSLLNMISGFYRPTSGTIMLGDRDITRARPSEIARLGVARTFQNIALFSGMTVLDNIMLGRHVHMRAGVFASLVYWGPAQQEQVRHRARVEELIEFLKLQDIRKQPSGALPYGLRKRVELGRALALDPKVLLLDEPMGGMNQEEKEDMARFVLDINGQWGTTIILIEHDMGVVMDISDRVAVLDRGRKIADGTPDEVQNHPDVVRAYLSAGRDRKGSAA